MNAWSLLEFMHVSFWTKLLLFIFFHLNFKEKSNVMRKFTILTSSCSLMVNNEYIGILHFIMKFSMLKILILQSEKVDVNLKYSGKQWMLCSLSTNCIKKSFIYTENENYSKNILKKLNVVLHILKYNHID